MSYRDEVAALEHRIEGLEREHAKALGRFQGLSIAEAEASERRTRADRHDGRRRWMRWVRGVSATVLGIVGGVAGGFIVTGGGCFVGPLAFESCDAFEGFEEDFTASVLEGALPAGTACAIHFEREADDEPCRARVRCGADTLYSGNGSCAHFFDDDDMEYWDNRGPTDDGTPLFVASEHESRAIVRTGERVIVLQMSESE